MQIGLLFVEVRHWSKPPLVDLTFEESSKEPKTFRWCIHVEKPCNSTISCLIFRQIPDLDVNIWLFWKWSQNSETWRVCVIVVERSETTLYRIWIGIYCWKKWSILGAMYYSIYCWKFWRFWGAMYYSINCWKFWRFLGAMYCSIYCWKFWRFLGAMYYSIYFWEFK